MSPDKIPPTSSEPEIHEPATLHYRSMTPTLIAIEPPSSPRSRVEQDHTSRPETSAAAPPSFESSQFDIILRHQRQRPRGGGGTKYNAVPSRFLHLSNQFEFSGWGTLSYVDLAREGGAQPQEQDEKISTATKTLGQFTASALAGNAVLGSVFYALPAVVAASSIYSPISLLIATCMLFLWRPIMEELASALPINGAPYTYMLNVASKRLAVAAAALLLLDYAATSVVSAATAMTYLNGEVTLPFPVIVGALLVLILFTLVSLSGLRDSARVALGLLLLHLATMTALFVASTVAWARMGNAQLRSNWAYGQENASQSIARQIFNGVCVGVLGLTGFECVPSYAASIREGRFPKVLRNLHYPAIALNVLSVLFVLALVPLESALQGANLLSLLSQIAAGRWLRIWIVVDAMVVLCGGVLTGILGACELFERLAHDRILPQLFLRRLPITHAPGYSIVSFLTFGVVLYASSGASLDVMSKMFSLVWLFVMGLFPLAGLLLKYNRGRLPRAPHTPVLLVFLALGLAATAAAGNVALAPVTIGYAAAYFAAIAALFYATMQRARGVHALLWVYDQMPWLHALAWTRRWGDALTAAMRRLRRQPVCVLIKTDEINLLFHTLLYVTQNEETACLKLVHFFEGDEGAIPSEMEANWRILDEAFPEITVDLILVRAPFAPATLAALARTLGIPPALMFMSCPGPRFPHDAAAFGTRIITL